MLIPYFFLVTGFFAVDVPPLLCAFLFGFLLSSNDEVFTVDFSDRMRLSVVFEDICETFAALTGIN